MEENKTISEAVKNLSIDVDNLSCVLKSLEEVLEPLLVSSNSEVDSKILTYNYENDCDFVKGLYEIDFKVKSITDRLNIILSTIQI